MCSKSSVTELAPWENIADLVRAFEKCTLPKSQWTHLAHLTIAHHYLWHHSREDATMLMRSGIQRYNLSQNNPTGYHETITLAWLAILARQLREREAKGRLGKEEAASAREVATTHANQDILLEYYSRELLMSEEARAHWVPPDRRAIE